jgi:hypothetical protein
VHSTVSGDEFPLTTDGEEQYDYAGLVDSNLTTVTNRRVGREFPAIVLWSPDSKKILTRRIDQRHLEDYYLLQSAPEDGSLRPRLYPYRYQIFGDPQPPLAELVIFEVEQNARVEVKYPSIDSLVFTAIEKNWVWWSQDGKRLYFIESLNKDHSLKLCGVDPASGTACTVLQEVSDTRAEPNL